MSETKLEEMLRLQQPPMGFMMDARSVTERCRAEGKANRRKRKSPDGTLYYDPKRPGHKRLGSPKIRPLDPSRSAYLGD